MNNIKSMKVIETHNLTKYSKPQNIEKLHQKC